MLTEFTTYDDIRAALGISDEELDDETLDLAIFETLLEEDMFAIDPDVLTYWNGLPTSGLTPEQTRFQNLVKLFSTYAVAYRLLNTAELFGFIKVTDSRATMQRTADAYKNLRVNVTAMFQKVGELLLAALYAMDPAIVLPDPIVVNYISAVGGGDPVTDT